MGKKSLIWEDNKEVDVIHIANVNDDNIKLQFGSGSYFFVVKEKQIQ